MPDPVSLSALFEAAEQAAVAGDYATAARHLGEVARVQEATLGPDHPDLANTLNNLAVAHERCGEIDAAEREYRGAHALAARIRPADDPLVTTSAQNLREFCEANGRPVDPPAPVVVDVASPSPEPAAPPVAAPPAAAPLAAAPPAAAPSAAALPAPAPSAPAPRVLEPITARPVAPVRPTPTPAPSPSRPPAAAAPRRAPIPVLVGIGAIVVVVIWLFMGRGPTTPPAEPQAAAPAPTTPAPTPAGPASPAPPAPTPDAPPPRTAAAPAAPAATTATSGDVTVGDAELCATLSSTYTCEPARSPVAPGRLTFYTRLIASQDTSVVHRWYRGDQLRQAVRLGVAARRGGYRTFSRGTVNAGDGEWRVELRTRDGRLLHTERFTVR